MHLKSFGLICCLVLSSTGAQASILDFDFSFTDTGFGPGEVQGTVTGTLSLDTTLMKATSAYILSAPESFSSTYNFATAPAVFANTFDVVGDSIVSDSFNGRVSANPDSTGVYFSNSSVVYEYNGQTTGSSDVAFTFIPPVPLPASAPMFGAALLALGAVGCGMKRRAAFT